MPLTPLDLQQIAGIVSAGQLGYLPPARLGTLLQYQVSRFTSSANLGNVVAQANANRVGLGFLVPAGDTTIFLPPGASTADQVGIVPGSQSSWAWMTIHTHGVLPQLEWRLGNLISTVILVVELIYSPPG